MKKNGVYFFIFLVAIFLVVLFDLHLHQSFQSTQAKKSIDEKKLSRAPAKILKNAETAIELSQNSIDSKPVSSSAVITKVEKFEIEFNRLKKEFTRSEKSFSTDEKKIQSFARQLEAEEIVFLINKLKLSTADEDHIVFIVDLLSRNQSTLALTGLKDFAIDKDGPVDKDNKKDVAMSAYKAQAIEGIATSSSRGEALGLLKEIRKLSKDRFIQNRSLHALTSLEDLQIQHKDSSSQNTTEELNE